MEEPISDRANIAKIDKERESLQKASKLSFLHWFVLIASGLLTLFAWTLASEQHEELVQRRFEREAKRVIEQVAERMTKYEDVLWSGVGMLKSHNQRGAIDRNAWRVFATNLDIGKKYPGINGIGVIYHIKRDGLSKYLREQKQNRGKFDVFPRHSRDDLLPITLIEPEVLNAKAIGLDVAHEANRFNAAIGSRDSGKARITGPITLVQDDNKTPGFLFYAPFYLGEQAPDNQILRKNKFLGLVYAPFIVRNLMEGTLAAGQRHVSLKIIDDHEVIYNELSNQFSDFDSDYQRQLVSKLDFYGRTWTFDIRSSLSFRENAESMQPMMILVGGIVIDFFLFVIFTMLTKANYRALDFADRVNLSLKSKTNALEKANQAKNSFLSTMSHELRTPLTAILGYTELIHEEALETEATSILEYTHVVKKSGDYLLGIISDLLSITMAESGQLKISNEDFNIETLVDEIGATGLLLAKTKDNVFSIESKLGHRPMFGDKGKIKHILINLIANSAKFTEGGSISVKISEISTPAFKNGIEISVSDTGHGIEKEKLSLIFERFSQVHDITNDSLSGVGLGLSLTKELVNLLHGSIRVVSELGIGTTFTVALPIVDRDESSQ